MERGATLPELLLVLLILGVTLAGAWPGASRGWDRLQVTQAREEVLALLSRARMEATSRGGAEVVVIPGDGQLLLVDGSEVLARVELASRGVGLTVQGAHTGTVRLRYDGMGVGRVASRTLGLSRGSAHARIVISSFGRATRQ